MKLSDEIESILDYWHYDEIKSDGHPLYTRDQAIEDIITEMKDKIPSRDEIFLMLPKEIYMRGKRVFLGRKEVAKKSATDIYMKLIEGLR